MTSSPLLPPNSRSPLSSSGGPNLDPEKGPEPDASTPAIVSDKPPAKRSVWGKFRRDRMAIFGSLILLSTAIAVVFGPMLYTRSYSDIDFARSLIAPSTSYPLGTNDLGQDQLARLLRGGRVSLSVGVTAMAVSISLGTLIGMVSGFCGGLVDNILMRLTDIYLSLPQLPLL